MLSSNPSSSILKRRQSHRRQQSLEVPILANPLPANPRHQRSQHRRGLSLDQSLSTLPPPTGPSSQHQRHDHASSQDLHQYSGTPKVSIPQATDNQHPSDTQQILQETQQHNPSQPGHAALDFSSHLQRQLNGIISPDGGLPDAEEAKQQLQEHISWFQATYGGSAPGLTVSTASDPQVALGSAFMAQFPMTPSQQMMNLPLQAYQYQQTSVTHTNPHHHHHPHTVPNTPQQRTEGARSPPHTTSKHLRSQSFQYDTAPLSTSSYGDIFNPDTFNLQLSQPVNLNQVNFSDGFNSFAGEQSYASSAYSSSVVDPMSPSGQFGGGTLMPTVPEESLISLDDDFLGNADDLLDAAAADGSQSPDQLHAPQPYSPRQAALLALGDINASIEETGISMDQVNQYMSEQQAADSKWSCLYPGCGKRFGRKENIRAHIQTHLGDRQFKCNDCGKCFVRQHDLKRHAKIHSGVKPNVCPCGMSFARQDALTRHRQRGTCFGVLPGFEKSEEERKKRGRPRKERPDLESRFDKATRARRMDAQTAAGAAILGAPHNLVAAMSRAGSDYASPSSDSGASDHSSPMTPAPSSDVDEVLFNDFITGGGHEGDCAPFALQSEASWMIDTPPTSPASYHTLPKTIAPTMLSSQASPEGSSPASMDDVELALLAWRGEDQAFSV